MDPRGWSIFSNVYDVTHAGLWALLCAFALYFCVLIAPGLPAARAKFERERVLEIAAESRAYCEKWGMQEGTDLHEQCTVDLQAIRAKVEQRIAADAFF